MFEVRKKQRQLLTGEGESLFLVGCLFCFFGLRMERDDTSSERREKREIERAIAEMKRLDNIMRREREQEEERRRAEEARREWERKHCNK